MLQSFVRKPLLNGFNRAFFSTAAQVDEISIPQMNGYYRSFKDSGSLHSRKLRREKQLIPGVIYGVDKDKNVFKQLISCNIVDLEREIRSHGRAIENTLYEMVLEDDKKYLVTPRQLQVNPLTDRPLACNFLLYQASNNRMRIPFSFINGEDSPDIRRGCFVNKVSRYAECFVTGNKIPSQIVVDLSKMKNNMVLKRDNISFPNNCVPVNKDNFVVVSVRTARAN